MTDIEATWTLAFLVVRSTSIEGDSWLADRLEGEAIWQGETLLVEHRFGPDLLLGAHTEGLTVELDGRIVDIGR